MSLDVLSSRIGVPVPRGGSPSPLITKFMTIVGCVVRGGMLPPPCAVPVKIEATVPVGAFSHGVGRHHCIRAASGSCGYWSAGIIHARNSVTAGRSVREGNRTGGRIGRREVVE